MITLELEKVVQCTNIIQRSYKTKYAYHVCHYVPRN